MEGRHINLDFFEYRDKRGQNCMIIFCEFWIVNKTGLPLMYKQQFCIFFFFFFFFFFWMLSIFSIFSYILRFFFFFFFFFAEAKIIQNYQECKQLKEKDTV